ncbi:MAG: 5'/3'-nucleotidase SurE [Clostridiales Family XIII bacterium]|jgi:5'-nucleotidase|nr:5'/3'-nucleotidase SurE [Clostridiales Family XIII bacterium]
MNVLLTNDDGIEALGIHRLAWALKRVANVYVCAPKTQKSASGHGITIGRVVEITDAEFDEAQMAICLDGMPADCVKIGLEIFKDRGIEMDMVFSGFNHGMNLGTDTLYSGTVSAAVEGALCGLPSAAMSICTNFNDSRVPLHFDVAEEMAVLAYEKLAAAGRTAKKVSTSGPDEKPLGDEALGLEFMYRDHTILNINIPDVPAEQIAGMKVVPLSFREYEEWFKPDTTEEGKLGYHYSGRPFVSHGPEINVDSSDILANLAGYVTITPLHFDLTNFKLLEAVKKDWKL